MVPVGQGSILVQLSSRTSVIKVIFINKESGSCFSVIAGHIVNTVSHPDDFSLFIFDPFKILTENIYLVLILKPYAAAHCIAVRSEIIGGTVDCFQLILCLAAIGIVKAKLLTFLYQSFFLWHCCRFGNRCNCRHCLRCDNRCLLLCTDTTIAPPRQAEYAYCCQKKSFLMSSYSVSFSLSMFTPAFAF